MKRTLLCLVSVLFCVCAFAATYYVDAKTGNDMNSGDHPSRAFRSLQAVNRLSLQPGDSVLFRCGTAYDGNLKIQCLGAPGRPVVFSSYGNGPKPRLNGNGLVTATILVYNSAYLHLSGLEVTNAGATPAAHRKGIHLLLEDFGIAFDIRLSGLYVHDVNGSNVKRAGGGAGIHWTNRGRSKPSAFNGLLIEHCRIERTDRNGITSSGYWQRQEWFPSRNVIIRHNHLEDIGGDGIVPIGCDSALIEHNTIYRGGQRFPEGDAAAGIWPWSCDNTIIQHNEVAWYGGPWDSQGFDSDWNCRNTLIQYNYSHDNTGGFVLVCNDGNVKAPQSVGNTGTVIRYNVSINDGYRSTFKHAGFSPVFHFAGPTFNNRVYNNLVYITKARPPHTDSTMVDMDNWSGYADSTVFANNIFYTEGAVDYQMGKSTRNHYISNVYYGRHLLQPPTPGAVTDKPAFREYPAEAPRGFEALRAFMLAAGGLRGVLMTEEAVTDFFGNGIPAGERPVVGIHQNTIDIKKQ
ncbi:right-handed parallel beta-helix repeat-containing protein [Chitinophaga sp. XS-30]|uniref:right-handed parallel beta-helix repeat-containing protein n=1 Tax=Chitinophaga sp. XS-30 TaxID=2604421 RepID=UPI00143D58C6|nr:right-handed parallel beta-helix repeat-containing protein [Chitinophaga sp. XS-30]